MENHSSFNDGFSVAQGHPNLFKMSKNMTRLMPVTQREIILTEMVIGDTRFGFAYQKSSKRVCFRFCFFLLE